MGQTFKCKICDRPMPPRVYEFHLKKSHTPEEVQTQVGKNDKELFSLTNENIVKASEKTVEAVQSLEETLKNKPFDWGEVYPCGSCGEEYPAKAMPWHSKQAHGV